MTDCSNGARVGPPTVAVVGARRSRQGTGEFLAGYFASAGCAVRAILGTSAATVAQGQTTLETRYGIRAAGYLDLEALLAQEDPDILVIASPATCHLRQLELAAAARCQVLCEKPLWWPAEGTSARPEAVAERTRRLVEQFEGEGRILASVTQWPYVLDALFTLHPELRNQPPQTFALRLGPTSCGAQMVIDSGSHLLSLLQNLVGLGQLERLEGTVETEQAELRFEYCHPGGKIAVCYQLIQTPEAPRPAEIAINGRKMTRQLELDPYQVVFCSEDERLPVRDPLALLVEDFVRSAGGDDARSRLRRKDHLVEGMARLVELSALAHGLIEEDAE